MLMIRGRSAPQARVAEPPPTLVETVRAEARQVTFTVEAQGTVEPRNETQLVAEVSGTIEEMSPQLVAGGFFAQGDILLRIDPSDYEAAVREAEALVAQRRTELSLERARADQARRDWESLGDGEPTALVLRAPQLEEAEARLASAQATLDRARRDLESTTVRAPYDALVRTRHADLGQFVSPGTPLATLFGTRAVEVRLPLPTDELAFLDIPYAQTASSLDVGPPVRLQAAFAGQTWTWEGRIVRSEGAISPRSRVLWAVARVDHPYAPPPGERRPPLAVGMFVEAEIEGITLDDVIVLPRYVVRGDRNVLVVTPENTIDIREVDIVRASEDEVFIRGGLEEGEIVSLTALEFVVDGMPVRPAETDLQPEAPGLSANRPSE